MIEILLLENPYTIVDKTFHDANIEVQCIDGSLDENALIEALQGCQVIGIRSKTNLSRRVSESCPDSVCAGIFATSTGQTSLRTAAIHGVVVSSTPYSNTRSVAELIVSEIIALARLLPV